MGFRTSRSRLLDRQKHRTNNRAYPRFVPGEEVHVILPYDDKLIHNYGEFLDSLDKIAQRWDMSDEMAACMYSVCDLTGIVTTMIHESFGDTCITESIQDIVYGDFPEPIAADIIEELTEIHNQGANPSTLDYLVNITKHDHGVMLQAVTLVREEDSMIYTFVKCSDDEDED